MSAPDLNNVKLLEQIYNNDWITPPEKRVLELKYQEGLFNYQIAMKMNCSTKTIERMLKKLFVKIEPIILDFYKTK